MKTAVIGFLGTTLDNGFKDNRWQRWRPSLALCMHEDLHIDELHLLHDSRTNRLFGQIKSDIAIVSPDTHVFSVNQTLRDPWDFADVYSQLLQFCETFNFDPNTRYFVHLTTGTHVAQICWFLLINNHFLPAKILQTSPPSNRDKIDNQANDIAGMYHEIDLDLSRYDALTASFLARQQANLDTLKSNIATQNPTYNQLIEQIEKVASRSTAPILLIGATGAGKSRLARQLFRIKQNRLSILNKQKIAKTPYFIEVNCATLRGDTASSMLFGHVKGAFTGAVASRDGFLKRADGGLLFLDEIGELGLDEQAMLLIALETGEFYPVGSDTAIISEFELIAGTNKDLREAVQAGTFRADLFARLNTWMFFLPSLKERIADLPANLDYELDRLGNLAGVKYHFEPKALRLYQDFAKSDTAVWSGNFRDLTASMVRMTTLAEDNVITITVVQEEILRLKSLWAVYGNKSENAENTEAFLANFLDKNALLDMDKFEKIQLAGVINVCQVCKSQGKNQAEVGRLLFSQSRQKLKSPNDSDRVRKFLLKFGLKFEDL